MQRIAPLIRYRGGSSSLLDYCPVYRSYSNGDCTDESGFVSSWMPQGGQERCEHCRCFESTTNSYRVAPSCFRMRCLNTTVLEVRQGRVYIPSASLIWEPSASLVCMLSASLICMLSASLIAKLVHPSLIAS